MCVVYKNNNNITGKIFVWSFLFFIKLVIMDEASYNESLNEGEETVGQNETEEVEETTTFGEATSASESRIAETTNMISDDEEDEEEETEEEEEEEEEEEGDEDVVEVEEEQEESASMNETEMSDKTQTNEDNNLLLNDASHLGMVPVDKAEVDATLNTTTNINDLKKNLANEEEFRSINHQEPIHIFLKLKPLDEQETHMQKNMVSTFSFFSIDKKCTHSQILIFFSRNTTKFTRIHQSRSYRPRTVCTRRISSKFKHCQTRSISSRTYSSLRSLRRTSSPPPSTRVWTSYLTAKTCSSSAMVLPTLEKLTLCKVKLRLFFLNSKDFSTVY